VKFRYFVLDYNKTENIWDDNFRKVAQLSNEYDLFINCQHNLYHPASKKSLFICHFPHKQLTELAISLPEIQKRHLQKLFVRSYDVFVSNSEFTQEWLLRYWPALKRSGTKVLNPAVSISDTPVKSFSGKENIILTCGRIDPEKKMLELARIFHKNHKKLGSFELHITGSINADNRELLYYYDELKNLSLDNKRIKLHLNASFETLTSLYKRAKIYWHGMGYLEDVETNPIRTEHFGITVIEAMSYGCVPLVHDSGNPPTIIREAGLDTTWKSEQEAVEKLAKMINNPSLDQMACVAAEASIKFSEENFTRSLMKIIKENNLIDKKFAKNN
jgi:glycosyltransferase involved in cell wall biosynthesis